MNGYLKLGDEQQKVLALNGCSGQQFPPGSLQAMGVEPWVGTSDDVAKVVASDTEKWGRIIKRAGIVVE